MGEPASEARKGSEALDSAGRKPGFLAKLSRRVAGDLGGTMSRVALKAMWVLGVGRRSYVGKH